MRLRVLALVVVVVLAACGKNPVAPSGDGHLDLQLGNPVSFPTPGPPPDFTVTNPRFDPPSGTELRLAYPSPDRDIRLFAGASFIPTSPEAALPASVGLGFVCDDGSNGRIHFGSESGSWPDEKFPKFVYTETAVNNLLVDRVTEHFNPLGCAVGHEINAVFVVSKKGVTWYDLVGGDVGYGTRWDLIAYKQFVPVGWKVAS